MALNKFCSLKKQFILFHVTFTVFVSDIIVQISQMIFTKYHFYIFIVALQRHTKLDLRVTLILMKLLSR